MHKLVLSLTLAILPMALGAADIPVKTAVQAQKPMPRQPGVMMELWKGVGGGAIGDLTDSPKFKKPADDIQIVEQLNTADLGDAYGTRYTTNLVPATTGDYVFWISSEDSSELMLSSDTTIANLKKIAGVNGCVGEQAWEATPGQKSRPIHLEAGKPYLLRVLHKACAGNNHVEIAWAGPGIQRSTIPAACFRFPALDEPASALLQKHLQRQAAAKQELDRLDSISKKALAKHVKALPKEKLQLLTEALRQQARALENATALPTDKTAKKQLDGLLKLAATITPTPENPVDSPALMTLLDIEAIYLKKLSQGELLKLGAHRGAAALGSIPKTAKPVAVDRQLSSRGDKFENELVSTGLYALPGKPVTVKLPAALAACGLKLQIGHHLNGQQEGKSWEIMPRTTWEIPLDRETVQAVSPFGGMLFVNVPEKVAVDRQPFAFNGAIESPRFILGQDSDEQWRTLRNHPGPWGELMTDNFILVVHSEALRKLDNPTTLMQWWRTSVNRLEGFYGLATHKPFRMHTCFNPIMGCSTWPLYENRESVLPLLNFESIRLHSDGLFLHEHGHHCDDDKMIFGKTEESTTNWGGYYLKATGEDIAWKDTIDTHLRLLLDPADKAHQEIRQEGWYTTKFTHHWSYMYTSVTCGYANTFGWETLKECIHRFLRPEDPVNQLPQFSNPVFSKPVWEVTPEEFPQLDQGKIDKWLIFLSQEAKHDVRPYFAHFCLRPSPASAQFIDALNLPKWDLAYTPEKRVILRAGQTVALTSPLKESLTYAGDLSFAWGTLPQGVAVTPGDNGDFKLTARGGQRDGSLSLPFTITNRYGNRFPGKIDVQIVAADQDPQFATGKLANVPLGEWRRFDFPATYRHPVVLIARNEPADSKTSFVTRLRNLTSTGGEVCIQKIKGDSSTPLEIGWLVMEAGIYYPAAHGFTGIAKTELVQPEPADPKSNGFLQSYGSDVNLYRTTRFGQVQSANNPAWACFFWKNARPEFGLRFGCHYGFQNGTGLKPETVGLISLPLGKFQNGNTVLTIRDGEIRCGDLKFTCPADQYGLDPKKLKEYFDPASKVK